MKKSNALNKHIIFEGMPKGSKSRFIAELKESILRDEKRKQKLIDKLSNSKNVKGRSK